MPHGFSFTLNCDATSQGLGKRILANNKGRRKDSTGEETHYKDMGGKVVNRPQLPQHQGIPRRKKKERSQVHGGLWGGLEYITVINDTVPQAHRPRK